jgi:hypothetical protein
MPRHRFTIEQKIEGTRAALRSPYTPRQLKPSLRAYLSRLERQAKKSAGPRGNLLGKVGFAGR